MPFSVVRGEPLFYAAHPSRDPDAPALILLHGAAGTHLVWPGAFRRLPGFRVLLPDLPGHGRSAGSACPNIEAYSAVVAEWLGSMKVNAATLVGHSMGAAVALQLALDCPALCSRLVLLNSAARFTIPVAITEALEGEPAALIEQLVCLLLGPYARSPLVEATLRILHQVPPDTIRTDFRACLTFDVRSRLGEVRAPTLVVGAADDRMVSLADSYLLTRHIPNASLAVLPGPHLIPTIEPEQVLPHLLGFLGG